MSETPRFEQHVSPVEQLLGLITAENFEAIGDASGEAFAAPEVRQAIKAAIGRAYRDMDLERLDAIVRRCKPLYEEHKEAALDALTVALRAETPLGARMLMWIKEYPGMFERKVLDAANEALIRELNAGHVVVASDILEALQTASHHRESRYYFEIEAKLKEFFASPEGNAALKTGLLKGLLADEPTERLAGFMQPSDVRELEREVVETRMREFLDREDIQSFLKMRKQTLTAHYAAYSLFKKAIIRRIESGHIEQALEMVVGDASDVLGRDFMESKEAFDAVARGIGIMLESGDAQRARNICDQLRVPTRYLVDPVHRAAKQELSVGNYQER